jgi:hypothetical protein
MAGTYPFNPQFQAVNFKINTPTISSQTMVGKTRRVGMGVSFYTFSAKYNSVTAFDFGPVTGFLAKQYGQLESFQIVLPEISYSKSTNPPSTTPQTSASLPAGNNSITLSNCGASKAVLNAGDFFKFANHTKVYMCVEDCVSSAGGTATLYFSASCVAAVPSGTALTITAVPFTVMLDNEVQEYSVGTGGISTMSVDFREVW